jgi:hypothetical protein
MNCLSVSNKYFIRWLLDVYKAPLINYIINHVINYVINYVIIHWVVSIKGANKYKRACD